MRVAIDGNWLNFVVSDFAKQKNDDIFIRKNETGIGSMNHSVAILTNGNQIKNIIVRTIVVIVMNMRGEVVAFINKAI